MKFMGGLEALSWDVGKRRRGGRGSQKTGPLTGHHSPDVAMPQSSAQYWRTWQNQRGKNSATQPPPPQAACGRR